MKMLRKILVLLLVVTMMVSVIPTAHAANMNIGKNKAHVQNNLKVRFADVAGAEEEKEELSSDTTNKNKKRNNSFTEEALIEAWKSYTESLSGEKLLCQHIL